MKVKSLLLFVLSSICCLAQTSSAGDEIIYDRYNKSIDITNISSTKGIVYLEKGNGMLSQRLFENKNGEPLVNSLFFIRYDYILVEDITIPEGSILLFDGGTVKGKYTITGCKTDIVAPLVKIIENEVALAGSWDVSEIYPEWFGAIGDGKNDDTRALEKCFSFAASQSIPTKLNARTYIVQPNKVVDWNVEPSQPKYVLHAAFLMKSNMTIVGEDKSVLKLKDNYVTPTNQNRFFLFFTNEILQNVTFENVTIDLNGVNNRFNPNSSSFMTFQQAAIGVSSVYNGKRDARIDNMLIDRCKFLNNAGGNCIITGVSNSNIKTKEKGKYWVIRNCIFKNNGIDSDDHSTIFAYADDVLCVNNTFTADTPFPNGLYPYNPRNGAYSAFEVHGDNQSFVNNVVENYGQGIWITPHTNLLKNTLIKGNKFVNLFRYGMRVLTENSYTITDVTISENEFVFTASGKKLGVTTNIALSLGTETGKCENFIINKNRIKYLNTDPSVLNIGVSISKSYDMVSIDNNIIEGCASCVYIASDGSLGTIKITNNTFKNLYSHKTISSKAIFFKVNDNTNELTVSRNEYKNDHGNIDSGIHLKGKFNKVAIHDEHPKSVNHYFVNDKAVIQDLSQD